VELATLPSPLLDYVGDFFNQLRIELEDEAESQFGLGENGYIFLLEAGDNVRDLGNVGLNCENIGLRKHWTAGQFHSAAGTIKVPMILFFPYN
jgi:hypothetical protein